MPATQSAAEVMEETLPDADERRTMLEQLVRSSAHANRIAPSAWAVTLFDKGFRLNVGQVEALTLSGDTVRVLMAASSDDPRLARLPTAPSAYKPVPGPQSVFVGSVHEFVAARSILEPFHIDYIEAAAKTSNGKPRKGTPFIRFNNPDLLAYAAASTATSPQVPESASPPYGFKISSTYTRRDIFQMVGVEDHTGGPWFTGYTAHGPDWFIFCGVGTGGRTGHDYDNHFEGDHLVWFGKGKSNLRHPTIRDLLSPAGRVYLFYREKDRDPFAFAGFASPVEVFDTRPVKVIWKFESPDGLTLPTQFAEEVPDEEGSTILEGAKKSVLVNIYERDLNARRRCIERWGLVCQVCSFDFAKTYGELGAGFIHVHHLKPLGELRQEYQLNPESDLRPVCPNCHAMLHRPRPALDLDQLRGIIEKNRCR